MRQSKHEQGRADNLRSMGCLYAPISEDAAGQREGTLSLAPPPRPCSTCPRCGPGSWRPRWSEFVRACASLAARMDRLLSTFRQPRRYHVSVY